MQTLEQKLAEEYQIYARSVWKPLPYGLWVTEFFTKLGEQIYMKKKKGAPKGNNNNKKEEWHCFTSKGTMRRQLDGIVLPILDYLQVPEATMNFLREDILGFVNRECRAVKIKKKIDYKI